MKAPWPKFSTSIRPNTSVSPDAMMKIIMPIAKLATVSVTHELPDPISGAHRQREDYRQQHGQQIAFRLRQRVGYGKVRH